MAFIAPPGGPPSVNKIERWEIPRRDAQPDPAVRRNLERRAHPGGARPSAEAQEARPRQPAAAARGGVPPRPARSRGVLQGAGRREAPEMTSSISCASKLITARNAASAT